MMNLLCIHKLLVASDLWSVYGTCLHAWPVVGAVTVKLCKGI